MHKLCTISYISEHQLTYENTFNKFEHLAKRRWFVRGGFLLHVPQWAVRIHAVSLWPHQVHEDLERSLVIVEQQHILSYVHQLQTTNHKAFINGEVLTVHMTICSHSVPEGFNNKARSTVKLFLNGQFSFECFSIKMWNYYSIISMQRRLMQFGTHDQLFVPLQVPYNQLIFIISCYKSKYFYATTKTELEVAII